MHNQFKIQKFKHLMLAMGPRDLNSAPYSPVHCSSHSMTSFQSSELTELPVVENSQLFAQRAHSARYAPHASLSTTRQKLVFRGTGLLMVMCKNQPERGPDPTPYPSPMGLRCKRGTSPWRTASPQLRHGCKPCTTGGSPLRGGGHSVNPMANNQPKHVALALPCAGREPDAFAPGVGYGLGVTSRQT